ncbi:host-nuclease inhibitor Gam family protein [Methylobacterium sp. WL6]|uniref:host-nuclease inhibitor Gam family protein n=1 Tax=Methylobacterium sp. WL6 TaxID=2603901 RepID=UPI0011C733CE|nr:host-nuclease inhibitor Gam family protein [Methylobacterium sp. WL6]TXN71630.1 hypothetical protein FV230_07730 [Methylobacterium sp. WL6]
MAKAKTKAAGTNLPVPQNDADAEQLIARLGVLQREDTEAKATHDAVVAALEEKRGTAVKVFQEVQGVIVDALNVWATANRDRLTNGGKTKTVRLPTGSILWRDGKYSVKHRGLKNEDVVIAIKQRITTLQVKIAEARKQRRVKQVPPLVAEIIALEGFLREKVEPNKEAMLAAREIAETIPGVTVPRGGEEFVVEPLASQIGEVASS